MAIIINLDNLLYDRRMTLTELADRIDITLANLSILKTGKARAIRFSTLDAICRELSCQPGDILQFELEQAEPGQPDRPIDQVKSDKEREDGVKVLGVN
jgi:putative transcriptional regulator